MSDLDNAIDAAGEEVPNEGTTEEIEGSAQSDSDGADHSEGSQAETAEAVEAAGAKETGEVDEDGETIYVVKIDGEEREITEEELLRGYRMRESSDKRFQEAAEMRKQAEQLQELMKTDPAKAMKQLGLDPRQFSEEYISRLLEEQMMTPEEKELAELRRERDELHKAKLAEEESKKQSEYDANTQKQAAEYKRQIEEVITEHKLPHTPTTINRLALHMEQSYMKGNTEITAKDVVADVKAELDHDLKSRIEASSIEDIIGVLGEDFIKKVRAYDTGRLKNPKGETPVEQPKKSERTGKKEMTKEEVRAFWDKLQN